MTCPWPIDEDCLPPDWTTLPDGMKERGLLLASRTLERLTGYRVGVCPVTIRPCLHTVKCGHYAESFGHGFTAPSYVTNWGGTWSNGPCGCTSQCEVRLPAPIGRIDEVRVNGVVLQATDYEVHNSDLLVWTGEGDCPFPSSQDMSLPITEPGTMAVTYVNAYPPGPEGTYAASVLALEFGLACAGENCRLPDGVRSIVRQGISMEIAAGSFPDGVTGIHEVDAYTAIWNPRNIDPPVVWSPDLPQHRRIGG